MLRKIEPKKKFKRTHSIQIILQQIEAIEGKHQQSVEIITNQHIFFLKYPYFKRVAKRWLCMEPAWARNQEYYDTKPIKTYHTVNLLSGNLYKILLFLYWNGPTCIKLAWLIIGVVPRYQWINICLNVYFFFFCCTWNKSSGLYAITAFKTHCKRYNRPLLQNHRKRSNFWNIENFSWTKTTRGYLPNKNTRKCFSFKCKKSEMHRS